MIQIDDAGSGSFVGGTCIGIYRPETNDYYFDFINVDLYNEKNIDKKLYLGKVVEIAEKGFKSMNVEKGETIEFCRGYMFDKLKTWLSSRNYVSYTSHITGKVQEVVEKSFSLYAVKLGLPQKYIEFTHYPFHFHKLLRWVFADFENRISFCKVGWKSWKKYKDIKPEEFNVKTSIPNLVCLKCGKLINPGSTVRVLRYVSNKENLVYLHEKCEAVTPAKGII
ncbi:MAG: hypothetical protein PHV32_01330 [Eubacteriales bacterium]|nr:hypothetical protein [Eubacteriales bacterium]